MLTGLWCGILKSGNYDCTNGGISSKHENITLIFSTDPDEPWIHEDEFDQLAKVYKNDGSPYLFVHQGRGGRRLVATMDPYGKDYGMMGGNWIHTSDSRFPSDAPIAIHDRIEN